MQVIQLFCNVPYSSKDYKLLTKDIRRMTASFKWDFSISMDFCPSLFGNIENPEIIKLLRSLILASKYIHETLIERCRVSASGTRNRLTGLNLYILPHICWEIIDGSLISLFAVLKPSKNDHQSTFCINDSCMLISCTNLVSSSSDQWPSHRSQIQVR